MPLPEAPLDRATAQTLIERYLRDLRQPETEVKSVLGDLMGNLTVDPDLPADAIVLYRRFADGSSVRTTIDGIEGTDDGRVVVNYTEERFRPMIVLNVRVENPDADHIADSGDSRDAGPATGH